MNILIRSRNRNRKIMQYIRITRRIPLRKKSQKEELIQPLLLTFSISTNKTELVCIHFKDELRVLENMLAYPAYPNSNFENKLRHGNNIPCKIIFHTRLVACRNKAQSQKKLHRMNKRQFSNQCYFLSSFAFSDD